MKDLINRKEILQNLPRFEPIVIEGFKQADSDGGMVVHIDGQQFIIPYNAVNHSSIDVAKKLRGESSVEEFRQQVLDKIKDDSLPF